MIARGGHVRQDELLRTLDAAGYRIEPAVAAPGEAARRGGIVDIWPPSEDEPLRIELFGDEVESIRAFDPATQRSSQMRDELRIGPARELTLDGQRMRQLADAMQVGNLRGDTRVHFANDIEALRGGEQFDGLDAYAPFLARATLLDHLADDALVIIDEPADVASTQEEHDQQAVEARRDLELRGELPHGLPEPHEPWPALRDAIERRGAPTATVTLGHRRGGRRRRDASDAPALRPGRRVRRPSARAR